MTNLQVDSYTGGRCQKETAYVMRTEGSIVHVRDQAGLLYQTKVIPSICVLMAFCCLHGVLLY